MKLDREQLREHYAGLSDDALFAVERDDLVEEARECYDAEVAGRGFAEGEEDAEDSPDDEVCVCSFALGDHNERATEVRAVLEDEKVPCRLTTFTDEGQTNHQEYQLMVPSRFSLLATSLLDKAIFNAEMEEQWTAHLSQMSDQELRTIDLEAVLAGLADRMERLRRVYEREVAQRKQRLTSE